MSSLSRRAGLNSKGVSDILTIDGLRPRWSTIEALSLATGRALPADDTPLAITFAALIARLPKQVSDAAKARRLTLRLRWLMRAAGWVAEFQPVVREEVQAFLARATPATFSLSARSFATYKAEVMTALDVALPRARARGVGDIGGVFREVHEAIARGTVPRDMKLLSGSFLVYLHDQSLRPGDITQETLRHYHAYRSRVSPKGEVVVRKHVKRVACLLRELASRPEFARFGFVAARHPFADGRDRHEVPDLTIRSILSEFDTRVAPWALGTQSRDGQPFGDFVAWLDTQAPSAEDHKRACLRRGGIRKRDQTGGVAGEVSLSAHGFLLPRHQWSSRTLAVRRGFLAAGAKALFARTGYLVETLDDLTRPETAWSMAVSLADANQTGFESGYAASVMKMIVKLAADFCCRPEADIAELRASAVALKARDGMAARNVAKLRAFTPERIALFLSVSDRILDGVNARSDARRGKTGATPLRLRNIRFDIEQCRDVMCALAHEIMLVRAPRSANVIGMRLDWIQWTGSLARIVIPSTEVKLRGIADPDLVLELTQGASLLLRQFLEKVRPAALICDDEANPYLFPGQGGEKGQPYGNLLGRLVRTVFTVTGAKFHPHLYRHMIGWIWLREDIGMLPVVQRLLGHKNLQTTITYYAAIDESLAMQKWQENLNAQRQSEFRRRP